MRHHQIRFAYFVHQLDPVQARVQRGRGKKRKKSWSNDFFPLEDARDATEGHEQFCNRDHNVLSSGDKDNLLRCILIMVIIN